MQAQRLNITLPYELARDFKRIIPVKKRSGFIAEVLKEKIDRKKNLKKDWVKSLKANKILYKEIRADWAPLDVEGWPD